ncbi:Histone-lysine N-methyltransferase PRDM9 [Echinococcus granulosus]|uniref:Histone-lysine N-methyltransferase PRDM9 n=1 Tax=Echinococcus granulosus TaxID=6210 RepID=W6U933_ECHGR|nr:Histone-lysine N-methyltransferase PRDM9 [Echinococcus granulosus]EUB54987.1 Histone-lysine N-methyltransferase PRDM9 [Echinococcus granulosus]
MSILEEREQAVIRNLQLLRSMGSLTKVEELRAHKRCDVNIKSQIQPKQVPLKFLIQADELRTQKSKRSQDDRFPRSIFSRSPSDSDDSNWGSSAEELLSSGCLPISQPKIQKGDTVATNAGPFGCLKVEKADVNVIEKLSKSIVKNSATSGALMELHGVQALSDGTFPKSNITKLEYRESTPDIQDDRYFFCYICEKFYLDPCPTHPILWIRSAELLGCDAVKSGKIDDCSCGKDERNHAKRSAPELFIHVGRSSIKGAGLGAWAERKIPIGSVLGPYDGEIIPLEGLSDEEFEMRSRSGYAWLVKDNRPGTKGHLVDAARPILSNWLRFVNCARSEKEQNLVAIQYRGEIYYRACKFAKELGIHYKSYIEIENLKTEPSDTRKCSDCNKVFRQKSSLEEHLKVHSTYSPFQCPECKERFKRKASLKAHVENHTALPLTHDKDAGLLLILFVSGLKPYPCSDCKKSFPYSSSLRTHVATVHKGGRSNQPEKLRSSVLQNEFVDIPANVV